MLGLLYFVLEYLKKAAANDVCDFLYFREEVKELYEIHDDAENVNEIIDIFMCLYMCMYGSNYMIVCMFCSK